MQNVISWSNTEGTIWESSKLAAYTQEKYLYNCWYTVHEYKIWFSHLYNNNTVIQ